MEGKKEREKGEKGWKEEGLLLVQPHADQTNIPCAWVEWGEGGGGSIEGLRRGTPPLVPAPHTEPQNPHTVRTWTRHICLIINEWIHAVSERHADRAARAEGARQSHPHHHHHQTRRARPSNDQTVSGGRVGALSGVT